MADIELVIKIPEEVKNRLCFGVTYAKDIQTVCEALHNGTPIPDNATNGDVIMAMFPNVNVYEHNGGATYSVNNEYNFNATWWNSQYQKGDR